MSEIDALVRIQPRFYVAFFITKFKSLDEVKAKFPEAITMHIQRTREFYKRGIILMAGAFADHPEEPVTTMAVLISRETAEEFVKGDPFVLNGMIEKCYIREWNNLMK
ncbi:MAG: YciI family protein [Candidatus Bathyarchaeia archaeon]|jgi:uncharacterized protein YciI